MVVGRWWLVISSWWLRSGKLEVRIIRCSVKTWVTQMVQHITCALTEEITFTDGGLGFQSSVPQGGWRYADFSGD
jgi:hypothetical protein